MVECTVNLNSKLWLLPVALILTCMTAAIFCGFYVVAPGIQGMEFTQNAMCTTVRGHVLTNTTLRCGCGRSCKSEYPCVQLYVKYNHSTSPASKDVILYNNEVAMTLTPDCSLRLTACSRDKAENRRHVMAFYKKYHGMGHHFHCLISLGNPYKVILDTKYNLLAMLVSLMVPLLVFSAMVPLLLIVIYRRFYKRESYVIIHVRCLIDNCCKKYSGVATDEQV